MTKSLKLKDILKEKPIPVALGAGFLGFFAHLGFIEALREEGVEISMISGSSAGSLAGAILGSNVSTQDALKFFTEIPVKDIWDPGIGFGYLKWKKVEDIFASLLKPRIEDLSLNIAVSAFELSSLKTKVFTSGPTAPIIRASCTPPFLVHPAKIDGGRYLDGGIFDKHGFLGIAEDKRFISHFLLSHLPDRKWDFTFHLKKKRPNQIMICIPDLVEVLPSKLSQGYEAFECCFENTMKLLNTDVEELKNHPFVYS